jgi:hypothetical protein
LNNFYVFFFKLGKLSGNSLSSSVAEPEPHHMVGVGAVTQCGSGSDGSSSVNGIKHG